MTAEELAAEIRRLASDLETDQYSGPSRDDVVEWSKAVDALVRERDVAQAIGRSVFLLAKIQGADEKFLSVAVAKYPWLETK